ncbi:MAG: flagellar motor protein MotB [Ruminococcus sp.]|nr:hypothetical protein [Ruminococcus sp.]MBR4023408.1 flagellar motor protein MotB [Ruminococcus sp.]
MAALKRKKADEESGGNWMDTYGDMVTLLLTFFIVLYSMSTIEEDKWAAIVRAFNRNGQTKVDQIVLTIDGEGDQPMENKGEEDINGEGITDLDEFYTAVEEFLEEQNMSSTEIIDRGEDDGTNLNGTKEDNIYLSFQNAITFRPDTAILMESSYEILDYLGEKLKASDKNIAVVIIKGHTAKYDSSTVDSRILSSERASTIANYFEKKFAIPADKLVPIGLANIYPVADNNSQEGRAQNRRVEMSIIGKNSPLIKDELLKSLIGLKFDTSTTLGEVQDKELK